MKNSTILNSLLQIFQDYLNLYVFQLFKNLEKNIISTFNYILLKQRNLKIIIKTSLSPVHTIITCNCFLLFSHVSLSKTLYQGLLIKRGFLTIFPYSRTSSLLSDQLQTLWHPKSSIRCPHIIISPESLSHQPLLFIFLHILCLTNYLCPESMRNGGERHAKVLYEISLCLFWGQRKCPWIRCNRQIPKPRQETAINVKEEIMGSKTQLWAIWFYEIRNTEWKICSAEMLETLAKN